MSQGETQDEFSSHWKWFLCAVGLVFYLPLLLLVDLNNDEAIYGLMAQKAVQQKAIFTTTLLGQNYTPEQPLYAMLVNFICIIFNDVNSLTVRLPSVLALAIMVVTSATFTRHHSGRQAAVVSGSFVVTCLGSLLLGTHSHNYLLGAAFIAAAWVVWYEFSRERRDWNKAWGFSLGLIFLAVLSCGFKALFIFYLPLLFLKKPTDVRKRLFQLPHLVNFFIFGLAMSIYYAWLHNYTRASLSLSLSRLKELGSRQTGSFESWAFVDSFFSYPFALLFFLFPWFLFAWPPFCEAFRRVESKPYAFHFFRRVCLVPFFFFWFLPGAGVLFLLPSLVALAIMSALHYNVVVRRYEKVMRQVLTFLVIAIACSCFAFATIALYMYFFEEIQIFQKPLLVILPSLAICGTFFLWKKRQTMQLWKMTLLSSAMLFWVCYAIYAAPFKGRLLPSINAATLAQNLPENSQVFFWGKENDFRHLAEFYYLPADVITLNKKGPKAQLDSVIYVLSERGTPLGISKDPALYSWESISAEVDDHRHTLQMWKGIKRSDD